MLLKHLLDEGLKKTVIAERLGVSRAVIYHWIRTGQLERDVSTVPPRRTRKPKPAKLDPFKTLITTRLSTYPELSAARLFAECRSAGYLGGLSQLQLFVREVRPTPAPEPVVRFETPPGHQAQADFAEFRFPWGKRWAFLVVLGYSRLLWLQFYQRQTMQTVMSALEAAFTYFGGVPAEILFDQMKAVVVGDERPHGGRLLENAEFLRFAAHWDFRIRACRPYRAKTKGKVERPVFYVRDNFVYGREFLGDGDLNAEALSWLDGVANQRVHGTTREIPRERFEHAERAVLKPLAARPYQSLVVAPERLTARQLSHSQETTRFDTLSLDTRALVSVERRPLAAYAAYADAASPLCAEEGCP